MCGLCCSHTEIPGDLAVTHITEKYMDLSRQSPVKRVALQDDSSSLLASLPTMSNRTKSGIMANKLPAVAQVCKL